MKHVQQAKVRQELDKIREACIAYDSGNWNRALEIAQAARCLFNDVNGLAPLIPGNEAELLRLTSTTAYKGVGSARSMALGFVGLNPSQGGFRAMLATTGRKEVISFARWWDEAILNLMRGSSAAITRREVLLASAGVTDVMKAEDLAHLKNGFAISVDARFRDGVSRRVPLRFADLCILRQIGHELMSSPDLDVIFRAERPVPRRLAVEKEMDRFVHEFGGLVVKNSLGKASLLPFNADYAFPHDNIVAELKCLIDDKTGNREQQEHIQKLIDRYLEFGLIHNPGSGKVVMESRDMPKELQKELYQILSRAIRARLKHANKQIKQTKKDLKMESAHGLVLLANDGNYRLEPAQFAHAVDVALGDHFSAIDSLVLFTVNLLATTPAIDRHMLFWIPASRKNHPRISEEFLNRFAVGWTRHVGGLLNEEMPLVAMPEAVGLEALRYDQNISRARK